jgi:acyl carrier protein
MQPDRTPPTYRTTTNQKASEQMQTDTTLTDRVREIMAEVFGVNEMDIPEDVSQQSYSIWSSLEQVTLLVALEEEFGISLSTSEMMSMTSLPAIVAVLQKHRS